MGYGHMSVVSGPLYISKALYDDVIADCRSRYPKEACGILAGHSTPPAGQERLVVEVYPMRNAENSPIGYSMDPKEQLQIERRMRQRVQRMVGIYHSHTANAAYPSSVDVHLAISPELSYVIVSLKKRHRPDFQSYIIDTTKPNPITPQPVTFYEATAGGGIRPVVIGE